MFGGGLSRNGLFWTGLSWHRRAPDIAFMGSHTSAVTKSVAFSDFVAMHRHGA